MIFFYTLANQEILEKNEHLEALIPPVLWEKIISPLKLYNFGLKKTELNFQ